MSNIAQQIRWVSDGFKGTAALFKLTPPVVVARDDGVVAPTEYVVVSAVSGIFGPETYIFPTTAEGKVLSWHELPGSFVGAMDIWQALRNAGYEPRGIAVSDDSQKGTSQ